MAQTIKLKRSSVSGNTPSTSDLELGEVAINTYDGKMFIKKNDGSDSIVEIGGTSGTVTEAFKTIAVSGQSNVVADSATDTLTLVAGSNMTITTNASGDTVTFASSGGGGTQNVFSTFAVSGQSSVVADSTTDTLTLAAGSGINITTNAGTDTITIAATASAITVQDEGSSLSTSATTLNFVGAGVTASGTGATKTITIGGGGGSQNLFSNIGVSGQGTIQADSTTDTLTFEAGTGISLTTDTTNDKLTITATGGATSVANAASSIKEFKYDISSSTTTITGSDANSNTLAYEAGAIQVFLNGILLDPATDYTASNGTSVVLTDAAVSGDDVQIVAFNRKIVTANVGIDTFTGDGSTRAFTLSSDPVNKNNTRVMIDGVYQAKASYAVSGTTLTFGSGASDAPPNGSAIEVEVGFTQAEIGSTLDFADNAILRIGTGNDLQILHDGSNSFIKDTGTGALVLTSDSFAVKNSNNTENMIKALEDGAVELYFDNSKKLETVTGGVTITGTVTATTFSGDLSGTINTATTGTTQSASDNSTKLATTAYVTTALANLVDSAPGTLNTLNELAAALGDDANFSTTITGQLATKVGLTAATGAASIPAGTTAQRPGSPAAGQFRYNSTLNQFEGYTSSWGAIGGGGTNTFTTDVFTSSGSATFTLTQAVSSPNDCIVHIDGIYQTPTDAYTVSGTSLTFTATPASGRKVVVYSVKAGVSGNNVEVQTINGNGSDHTFTLNVNPINENNTIVHIDGVYQQKSSYSVSGTQLTFGAGNIPANGTVIEVATFTQTEINVPVNDTIDTVHIKDDAVTSAKLGGNLVTPGNLTATGTIATGGITINGAGSVISDSSDLGIASGGDLTMDVTGNIILDADGGDVKFLDGGTEGLRYSYSGAGPQFFSPVADKDIIFKGNDSDGGGAITALTLDMSEGGKATFANDIAVADNRGLRLGSDNDSVIYNDGSNLYIKNNTSNQDIIFQGNDDGSTGTTALTLDMSNGGAATFNSTITSAGITSTGNVFASDIIARNSGGLALQTDDGTKRLFIKDNGDVKVGNLAVGSATTAPLHVAKASTDVQAVFGDNNSSIDDPSIRIIGRDSGNSAIRYTFAGLDADANHGFIGYNAGSGAFVNALQFDTGGTVGIGTTDIHTWATFDGRLRIGARGFFGTTTGSNQMGYNWYYDGAYKYIAADFANRYYQNGGNHVWETGASGSADGTITWSEKMRIDSNGNLLIGTQNLGANHASDGAYITPAGQLIGRATGIVSYLNRRGSDGQILQVMKDGTSVGAVSTWSGNPAFGRLNCALYFDDDINRIKPASVQSNTTRDNVIDLGDPSHRFNDVWLGGGIHLGGTGSANKLDDYEEGIWTPTYVATGSNFSSITYSGQVGTYTKVGNLVTVWFFIRTSGLSGGSGTVAIAGLPFGANINPYIGPAVFSAQDAWVTRMPNIGWVDSNSRIVLGYGIDSSTSYVTITPSNMTNNNNSNRLYGCATYNTTS